MRQQVAATLLLLLSGLLAAGWTARVQSASHSQRVIRFAYVGAPDDARHLSALRFKERVEQASGGTLRVALFPGGQLGGDRDAIEGVRLGTIEMTAAGAGIFANFEPGFGVTALPFLFESFEEAWAFVDSPVNGKVDDRLLKQGVRVLAHWDNGFRCITNSVRPIDSPDDLRSLKIRTPENPVLLATLAALGANPGPLPWPELYMALQQRAFDGQENPIPTIFVNKLYEVQKYLCVSNHAYEPMPVVVNDRFWNELSETQREIVTGAVMESQRFNRDLVRRRTDGMLARLEEAGMIVSHPDRQPFREAASGVSKQFVDLIGADLIDAATQFVAEHRRTKTPPLQDAR